MVEEGTVVRSQGPEAVRFIVTEPGAVPAGPGQTISLPVRSLSLGSQTNLPAGSLTAIEGKLGTELAVTNDKPAQHGGDRQESAPTLDDRQELSRMLVEALEETALTELQVGLGEGDLVAPSSLSLINTLDKSFQPSEKSPANRLDLNLRLEYEAIVVDEGDIQALAETVLNANLPGGYTPVEGSLEVEKISPLSLSGDSSVQFSIRARRILQADVTPPQVVRLSLGLPPDQAGARMEAALPIEQRPKITLFPDWWPRLPILPFRISVTGSGD